jgi:hypothetical protein
VQNADKYVQTEKKNEGKICLPGADRDVPVASYETTHAHTHTHTHTHTCIYARARERVCVCVIVTTFCHSLFSNLNI